MLKNVILKYGLCVDDFEIESFGDGLINKTWKLSNKANKDAFILQEINKGVFKSPETISKNLSKIGKYLHHHTPDYLFVNTLPSSNGDHVVVEQGEYYKLSPFVPNSITINTVENKKAAYEAAKQFARFSKLLSKFDEQTLDYSLPNFHNLLIRFVELENQLKTADKARFEKSLSLISLAYKHKDIVDTYEQLQTRKLLPQRVMHHDTKINNVLFDKDFNGLCIIDLDTVMPGNFISDLGDMMRTYLSPANEEEKDLNRITIREDVFEAIIEGYMSEMGEFLNLIERKYIVYAGKFMIYMQAIRFLTDYLGNDRYYGQKYEGHNYVRASNQFALLEAYCALEPKLERIAERSLVSKAVKV